MPNSYSTNTVINSNSTNTILTLGVGPVISVMRFTFYVSMHFCQTWSDDGIRFLLLLCVCACVCVCTVLNVHTEWMLTLWQWQVMFDRVVNAGKSVWYLVITNLSRYYPNSGQCWKWNQWKVSNWSVCCSDVNDLIRCCCPFDTHHKMYMLKLWGKL